MSYIYTFYKNLNVRRSCSKCPYTNLKRVSDITLADFWGWQKSVPDMNKDDKGVSLVLSNTEKGDALLDAVKNQLIIEQVSLDMILQPQLISPVPKDENRDAFEEYYIKKGFVPAMKKYGDFSLMFRVKALLKKIKHILTRIIKK